MAEELNREDNLPDMDIGNLADLTDTEDIEGARQKLEDMIKNGELSEDVRESLKAMLSTKAPALTGAGAVVGLGLGLAVFVFSILLFFGYKLYKSIKDKEKRKEEKKKAKQQKKKK